MKRTLLSFKLVLIHLLLHWCYSGTAQDAIIADPLHPDKQGLKAIEANYQSFPTTEKLTPAIWQKVNPGKAYPANAVYKTFGNETVKYAEVVSKRTAFENYYINPDLPGQYTKIRALDPINFQRNGEWIPVDATLQPIGNNIYEATDQWDPVGINVTAKESYINTATGKVQFNDWRLYGVSGNDKVLLAKADWSQYTIGADGIKITNIFPGMDAEMRVSRGGVKTSFIIHRLNFTQYPELYFEDTFKGLQHKGLYFTGSNHEDKSTETVYADVSSEKAAIKISPAFGYVKNAPAIVTHFPFYVSGNKLSVAVPVDYISNSLTAGDVVIDPLVQSSNSIAASTVGTMFNASCARTNSCDYTIPITPPANATITQIAIQITIVANAPCGRENFGFSVTSGACVGGVLVFTGVTGPGTANSGFYAPAALLACIPAPSCTPAPMNIVTKLYRSCQGPTGCDNTCIGLTSPLAIRIQGYTAELTVLTASATSQCKGQDFTFSTSTANGVAPFSAIDWSYNTSGIPSLGTGPSITTGATLAPGNYTMYARATDACGTLAQTNLPFIIKPLPAITLPSGATICNGGSTNITPSSSVVGTTYSWTVVQTGVTGASNGSGASITQTLNNSGTTPGTAVYTITPTANGCDGTPVVYTVTVQPVSRVLYVDAVNGNDVFCGDTWGAAFKTFSRALFVARASTNVDSILVAKGTYYPTGAQNGANRDSSFVIIRGKLKMYGGYPNGGGVRNIATNPTILSGDIGTLNDSTDNSYHVMVITGFIPAAADSIVVDGFTFTKGTANGGAVINYEGIGLYQGHGAGMYMQQNATGQKTALRNLTFTSNTATILGGGLEIVAASPLIQNCTFTNNRALTFGGALSNDHTASPYVTGCSFTGNTANVHGGAVFTQDPDSDPTFINCSFTGNIATPGSGSALGGAMFNRNVATVTVTNCIFTANKANNGGGAIYNDGNAVLTITYSVFDSNNALSANGVSGAGGALLMSGLGGTVNLTNSVLVNNSASGTGDLGGGAIMVYAGTLNGRSLTLSGNTTQSTSRPNSHGISTNAAAIINFFNSIAWAGPTQQVQNLGTINYDHSLIKGSAAALPNLDLDPQFVNAANPIGGDGIWGTADDGLQLTPCSPAANMGNNALLTGIPTDEAGNARIFGTIVDMGAYELQASLTPMSFTNVVKTYGDADAAVPNITNCSGLPVTFAVTDNTLATMVGGNLHILKAGTTTITAHTVNGIPDVPVTLTINPKPITVSLTNTPISKVYDGNTNATISTAHLQFAPGDVVGTDDVTIALSSTLASYDTKDIGTGKTVTVPLTNISLTGTTAGNYVITNTTDLTAPVGIITQLAIAVTADVLSKVYGDVDPVLTYTFTPTLVPGDAFTGSLARTPGENMGAYSINQGTLALSSNYTVTYNANNLNITPKAITITADAKTKVYGDTDPALTYTYAPALAFTDAFTGSLARTPGENIGVYSINQGTLALSSNYTITYNANTLTITPKAITITADAKTKVYGDIDPALTYTFTSALITGDAFTGSLARTPGENIGAYSINQGSLALSSNYTITYNTNDLTITSKAITITADAQTKVYGTGDPVLTYTYTPALIAGDAFTGLLDRTPGENIGAYSINQGSLALSSNYTVTYNANNLTITPKAITITADSKTKVYGDVDPALTYTYAPALAFTDAFTGSLSRTPGENIGAYSINQGTLALSSNYTVTYNANNLTITPKAITITADAKTKVYGDTDPALTYTFTPALITGDAFTGSLARTPGENIGAYAINQGSLALSSNYTITYNANNLNITPKAITITADAKTKVYGDTDPALTYTYAPALAFTDAFTGSFARIPGENVGVYSINQGSLVLSSNYTISYNANTLTITPKAITITADAKTKVYGDADPSLTYTYSPVLIAGDAFTGSLSRTTGENIGAYTINQGTITLSSNYTITYNNASLTITTKPITVRADAKTKTYGDADPALTYTYSPALAFTDAFTGSLSRIPGENTGAYVIGQNTLAVSNNYLVTYVSANLVINKAVLTATAADKTICLSDVLTSVPINYTGFKFSDNVSAIRRVPVVNIPAYNTAGAYALTPSGGVADNYTFNYVNGQLTVLPIPAGAIMQVPIGPGIVNTPNVNSGMQLNAPAAGGYSYTWSTGESTASVVVRSSGTYSVSVTNADGCTTKFTTTVKQLTLIIPNIFSPNGDGIHDRWVIENLENYPGNMVQIYNRYGQVVYKVTNYTAWDGKVNGKEMPVGTYYYIIDPKNGQKPVTGFIDIIR